jgi:hypothetical protein
MALRHVGTPISQVHQSASVELASETLMQNADDFLVVKNPLRIIGCH